MILLCSTSDIPPNSSKGFNLEGQPNLFVVNKAGSFYAYENSCPHLGVNLEWQTDQFLDSTSTLIMCAMHGALFTLDKGFCVSGPCSGQHLKALHIEIKDDSIYLVIDQKTDESKT